jgi:hypothetical protein
MEKFITLLVDDKTFVINEKCITDKPDSYLANLIRFEKIQNPNLCNFHLNMFPEEFQVLLEYHRNERPFKPKKMTDEKYQYILNKYAIDEGPDIIYYNDCHGKKYFIDIDEFLEKITIILIDFKDPYRDKILSDEEIETSTWRFTFDNKNWCDRKNRYLILNKEIRKLIHDKMMWFFGEQEQFLYNRYYTAKVNSDGNLFLRHTIFNIKSIPKNNLIRVKDRMSTTTTTFGNVITIDSNNIMYSKYSIDTLSSSLNMDKTMFIEEDEEKEED